MASIETPIEDWEPFGAPLFQDASVRKLSKVGVVDIGSNSVRLVVFDGAARSPAYFYNEKVMCGLGAGMPETGRLNPEGKKRAFSALARFKALADGMQLFSMSIFATAAMREAEDGPEFCETVQRETGLSVHVIDGEEEARLSAQGVLLGWPGSFGLVCDIGGSSMELAEIHDGTVGRRITSPLGPLKFKDMSGGKKAREKYIRKEMQKLADHMGVQRDRLFLVGGSWRAIARIDMERRNYPLHVLHEYRMDSDAVEATARFIEEADLEELRTACGISPSRMALVPYATEVLTRLVRSFEPLDIAISSYGIREGMLYEQMPDDLRARDPLIEACRFAESKDARLPGFGKRLYRFVEPLFPDLPMARLRLVRAACLLHDVSWRAHPDYRAEVCFDYATRANLGGLKHWERIYLGLALLHRYRNKQTGSRFEALYDLVDARSTAEAEVLGKAMRLGAMLWTKDGKDARPRLSWDLTERVLTLHLSKTAQDLYGEVTEARFKSLATALDAAEYRVAID
ncbi:Ppx/GppA family phosphatase [Cognatishimia sp. F0-27]|uniref:Ppx/GppA family phosphatase n=1 Tax=Cognatishimia sp. F0-27 TaxID=2816855 RepID=UPI001D0C1A55|nr:Ppx/GppA family phosphatase [Cognatishimia sp. F0-27]MCC1493299.1 Ppx/GppA family phosphatase [Cognatishimia sp. F0-27]